MSDETAHDPYRTTLATNLGIGEGDRLALVTDTKPFRSPSEALPDRETLGRRFETAAAELGAEALLVTYPEAERSGIEPPAEVFEAVYPEGFRAFLDREQLLEPLLHKTLSVNDEARIADFLADKELPFDALLAFSGNSITHTRFRRLLTDTGRLRAATMPGVEPHMLTGVMTADWAAVERRSVAVARLLSAARSVEIHTAGDRVLTFSVGGRHGIADTGILAEQGRFGNLPGGEAFIAPLEGTAEGEVSVGPREAPHAHAFRFENGRMVEMLGDPPFRAKLEEVFATHDDARNLAELGVGTNEKADDPENILEAEKILGTIHLALGDNASFGGTVSVPYHQDYIIYRPTLRFHMNDGGEELVVEDGTLTVD